MTVVMVHGIWDTGSVFKPLSKALAARGHICLMPSLSPNDGHLGIADLAVKLDAYITANVTENEPIALVGFSMGTIVSRYYLQKLGGYKKTLAFISISGPHRGTLMAYFYPGQGARDMRFGSPLLKELDAKLECLSGLHIHSYRTPLDLMIVPARHSVWSHAQNHHFWALFHPWMLKHRGVIKQVVATLESWEPMAKSLQ